MGWRLATTVIAALLVFVAAVVFRRQRCAGSCPVHNRHAGLAAIFVAWICLASAAATLAYVWLFQ